MVVDEVETGLKPADGRQRQERSHAVRVAYASGGDKMVSQDARAHTVIPLLYIPLEAHTRKVPLEARTGPG